MHLHVHSADPWLSTWYPLEPTGADPHTAARNGEPSLQPPYSGLFRVGDPSQPFLYNGQWHMVLGAGRNGTATSSSPIQGELRLVRAVNNSIGAWEFAGVIYSSNETAGLWAEQLTNMFECPDFFPIGNNGKWMFITSQIFQGSEWVTGGNHHWDQYRIGTFDGIRFTPEVSGVLDYGCVHPPPL
jgi:sucrose-6-phosphate hydrolase SacC (GH32 family)